MAQEIKNTFLKAKMNKDLDDRIIPNGEYRDALNIGVGKSESDNVGSIENLIGNNLMLATDLDDISLEIIGVLEDSANNRAFVFLTDYTDPNPASPTEAPTTSKHFIYLYDATAGSYSLLVTGYFLNFSKTNRIIGVNLIETLLFWTDNRNQPRKINISLAINLQAGKQSDTPYYTQEHQISVAKYAPYEPIRLLKEYRFVNQSANISYLTVDGDFVNELTPFIGGYVLSSEDNVSGDEYIKVTNVTLIGGNTRLSVAPSLPQPPVPGNYFTLMKSTMTNKNDDDTWPGDPDYLESRFVRFSYRFQFDDNEFSVMAPFTQIAYIPKQKGFFIAGDEDATYRSTIVDFMENNVQDIGLQIPIPTTGLRLNADYKIAAVEILYRESDSIAVKVLESVTAGEISAASQSTNIYQYDYQSRKPYRTLPELQTVRVYDKVPIRAFAQETSGNRIIYGNYRDQHTPPTALNYNCRIAQKIDTGKFANFAEYPNHTVKRNRNYQVGFVLSDKYGRTSPVILSNVDLGTVDNGIFYSGSTIYSPYDTAAGDTDVMTWFGDAIQVIVNEPIESTKNQAAGTPGLYAEKRQDGVIGTGEGFAITSANIVGNLYTFKQSSTYINNDNIPQVGDYLRGKFTDFVEVTVVELINQATLTYNVTTLGQVSETYLRTNNLPTGFPDLKFAYTINDLGWYSYKIVVKQTEQEYYNVYLPGILNGYPGQNFFEREDDPNVSPVTYTKVIENPFPDEIDESGHIVLYSDNINKVPRDLALVGPDQEQYRSSVVLYGRVTNVMNGTYDAANPPPGSPPPGIPSSGANKQFYARNTYTGKNAIKHTATQIANVRDFNMSYDDLSLGESPVLAGQPFGGVNVFYSLDTSPLVCKLDISQKPIGWTNTKDTSTSGLGIVNMTPFLAIYETEPVESLLEIYWETASTGLIVDLNQAVLSVGTGATGWADFDWQFDETNVSGDFVTNGFFYPLDAEGNQFSSPPDIELTGVTNGLEQDVTSMFTLVEGVAGGSNAGKVRLRLNQDDNTFTDLSFVKDVFEFTFKITTTDDVISTLTLGGVTSGDGALKNIAPSFNNIIDITIATNDTLVVPGNYPGLNNGASNTQQIEYSFTGGEGADWQIDSATGEITQTPGVNPNGLYTILLKVKDANATTEGSGDYGSLEYTQTLNVSIGYATVNDEALQDYCLINGTDEPTKVIKTAQLYVPTSGVWFVTADEYAGTAPWQAMFPQAGPINTAVRMGTGAHTSGTICFDANIELEQFCTTANIDQVQFWWRKVGTTPWTQIENSGDSFDFNNSGLNPKIGNFPNYSPFDNSNSAGTMWIKYIRAIDHLATGSGANEYAIIIKNLQKSSGQENAYGYVNVSDLHYSTCIPRQNNNIAFDSGGTRIGSWEYKLSAPSANSNDVVNDGLLTVSKWAETPYGDYVNAFFDEPGLITSYLPPAGTPNVNFSPVFETNGGLPWSGEIGNSIKLKWVAGFSSITGERINEAIPFICSARQTTTSLDYGTAGAPSVLATTRFKRNQ
mgnify:FL=1